MGEVDEEMAFLSNMQAPVESIEIDEADSGSDGQDTPAISTQDNHMQEVEESSSAALGRDTAVSQDPRSPSVASSASLVEPSRPSPTTGPVASNGSTPRPASQASARTTNKKPRTHGGFVIDEDEEEESEVGSKNGHSLLSPGVSQERVTPSPLNNVLPTQDLSLQSTEDGDAANATPAFSELAAVSQPDQTIITNAGPQPSNHSVHRNGTVPIQKARLPHDRIGMLEDRIKDDPKGDLDAWLSLIAEHRKRNKLDDARGVYDRFFKVFPLAVSNRN
jgi:cleavage stimulation factor subunit 3